MQTLKLSFSYQNIVAGQGFELVFAGMTIVFTALVLVSVFVTLLPRILSVINPLFPETQLHTEPQTKKSDESEIAAAIGFALHVHQRGN